MKTILLVLCALFLFPAASAVHAQSAPEGIWEGYDGEWQHVTKQVIDLANAIPADKYSWRPAPGVRSVSEVFMHIATSNFWLLSETGAITYPKALEPDDIDTQITSKPEVIDWLTKSFEAVRVARAKRNACRAGEESPHCRSRRATRRHLPPHPHPRQRAYGTACRLLAHERHRSAVVEIVG